MFMCPWSSDGTKCVTKVGTVDMYKTPIRIKILSMVIAAVLIGSCAVLTVGSCIFHWSF